MMISNCKLPFGLYALYKSISALQGLIIIWVGGGLQKYKYLSSFEAENWISNTNKLFSILGWGERVDLDIPTNVR